MTERKSVSVLVASQEQYDPGPFCFGASYEPGSLDAVLASLVAVRDSIPAEYRDRATCEIRSVGGYEGSHYAMIEVRYSRLETDDEMLARTNRNAAEAARTVALQRRLYEELRAKFEQDRTPA